MSDIYGDSQPVHVTSNGEHYSTNIVYVKTAESEGEYYPTQKPIELGKYFVRTYLNLGEVIIDSIFGSNIFLVTTLMKEQNLIGVK